MWTLFTIFFLIICIKQISELLEDYLSYNTVNSFDLINEIPSPFPAITICNLNPYQTEFALQYLKNISIDEFKNAGFDNFDIELSVLMSVSQFNNSLKKQLAFDIEEILINCVFIGQPCSKNDFDWYFHPTNGICYRFNSQLPPKSTIQPGYLFGLRLELFVGNEVNIPSFVQNAGYKIIIGNQTDLPKIGEGYMVSPGTETGFEMTRLFQSRLPEPYSACSDNTFDSEFDEAFKKLNQAYSQELCFTLYSQNKIIEQCKCYSPLLSPFNSFDQFKIKKPCLDAERIICALNTTKFLVNDDPKNLLLKCPSECNKQTFGSMISSSLYPTQPYAEKLMNNSKISSKFLNDSLTLTKLKNSVLAVSVYYKDLYYTRSTEQAKYARTDLISNIGGILGLYIGNYDSICALTSFIFNYFNLLN